MALSTLVIGDEFIPASSYAAAFTALTDQSDEVRLRTVHWSGAKSEQHAQQQVMERDGANAIPAPAELLDTVPGAEALCLHFAPVGDKVIVDARSGGPSPDIVVSCSAALEDEPREVRLSGLGTAEAEVFQNADMHVIGLILVRWRLRLARRLFRNQLEGSAPCSCAPLGATFHRLPRPSAPKPQPGSGPFLCVVRAFFDADQSGIPDTMCTMNGCPSTIG